SGDDFISLDTSNLETPDLFFKNNYHFLTYNDSSDSFERIKISNMGNFRFFGKEICDKNGDAYFNVTDSGYVFFDKIINITDDYSFNPYPIIPWIDAENDWIRNQTVNTDSMFINTIMDIRNNKGGYVKYADREN